MVDGRLGGGWVHQLAQAPVEAGDVLRPQALAGDDASAIGAQSHLFGTHPGAHAGPAARIKNRVSAQPACEACGCVLLTRSRAQLTVKMGVRRGATR